MISNTHHMRLTGLAAILFILILSGVSGAWTGTYTYDEMNRLKLVQYDSGGAAEYFYDGAGNRLQIQSPDTTPPVTTASPPGGLYSVPQTVTLVCDDGSGSSGCDKTYYSTNGITPTASSALYSSPISITATTTVKYFSKDRDGNAEVVKAQTYTIDQTAPTASITINSGATYSNSLIVTLTVTCSDANGCSQMRFSNDNATYSTPETYAGTKVWTLTTGEGAKSVYAQFKDGAGNWSSPTSSSILLDTTPPTGAISASPTNSTTVSLTVSCADTGSGCAQMAFSNDNVTYSTARTYATQTSWTLTSGSGSKTVYAKFSDVAGNWSPAFTGTILLDTVAPITTATASPGGTYIGPQTVTLTCNDGAGSGCDKIFYTADGTTPSMSSTVYAAPINVTVTATLKYFATDIVGNAEAVKTIFYALLPVVVASPAGGAMANNPVLITLTCYDGSGPGCDKIYYTTNGNTPTTSSSRYTSPISLSFPDHRTTKTLKFFATDKAGKQSGVQTAYYYWCTPGLYCSSGSPPNLTKEQKEVLWITASSVLD